MGTTTVQSALRGVKRNMPNPYTRAGSDAQYMSSFKSTSAAAIKQHRRNVITERARAERATLEYPEAR